MHLSLSFQNIDAAWAYVIHGFPDRLSNWIHEVERVMADLG